MFRDFPAGKVIVGAATTVLIGMMSPQSQGKQSATPQPSPALTNSGTPKPTTPTTGRPPAERSKQTATRPQLLFSRNQTEIEAPSFSPDGSEIVLTIKPHEPDGHEAEAHGYVELKKIDAVPLVISLQMPLKANFVVKNLQSGAQCSFNYKGEMTQIAWSPDSSQIAFITDIGMTPDGYSPFVRNELWRLRI